MPDYAISRDMPVFAVVISDGAIDRKVREVGRQIIESEHPQELELFRRRVLSRVCSFFMDAKDIKLAVHETISDFLARNPLRGWVRGDDPASLDSLLAELARVSRRNEKLKAECKRFQLQLERPPRNNKHNWSDEELDAIASLLQPLQIEAQDGSGAETTSLLWAVHTFRDQLVTGISNHVGMSDKDKLLFFEVCPKLAVYELASLEKVAGVAWQRFILTAKGRALLAYFDRAQLERDSVERLQNGAADLDRQPRGSGP